MATTTTPAASYVLIATDFSESAEAAFGVAIEYARRLHARLHVLHVFSPGEIEITQLLADAAARAERDVPVTVAGAGGDPATEILRCADRLPADLIVVGTHGRTGVSGLLLGSVAERVVRGARCPVLVVPAPSPPAVAPAPAPAGTETDEAEPVMRRHICLVCANPTLDLICEPCRTRIRGEALEHKRGEERAGRS